MRPCCDNSVEVGGVDQKIRDLEFGGESAYLVGLVAVAALVELEKLVETLEADADCMLQLATDALVDPAQLVVQGSTLEAQSECAAEEFEFVGVAPADTEFDFV